MGEMGVWEEGRWRWDLGWHRELRANEREWEEELKQYLKDFTLIEGIEDTWRWSGTKNGNYSVKEAYKELEKREREATKEHTQTCNFKGIWRSLVPYKAQITAWRLLLDRLPNADNLEKQHVSNP